MAEVTDAAGRPPIDVIVPVHGAGVVFRRCAASLAAHVDPARARVIVVVDGPDDPDIVAALAALAARGLDLLIEREPTPRGFVRSANRGMRLSQNQPDRDVVLLNSDTQVTAGWLDGLSAAAYSDPRIATVTPFSNNATICSLPRFLAENTLPAGYDVDTFAALVARAARPQYPRLPTGVGSCLFIKRSVLREIGLLDEAFGLGYGEEIDFCLRATTRGYAHVLDDATFIYHEGSRSFGTRRASRIRRAHRLLRSRYPNWWRTLADFIARDPIAPARTRVAEAMRTARQISPPPPAGRRRRVLHVVHGWPPWAHGGTEQYAYGLAMRQRERHEVSVYARIADPDRLLGDVIEHDAGGVRVRLIVNNFTQRNPLCRSGFHCRRIAADFRALLDDVRPDIVHVHHIAGHCASLMTVARRRGLPIVYQLQDWWPLCARTNLVDRHGALCSGPTPTKCARCLPLTGLPGATLGNPLLYTARHHWLRRQLACANAFIMGSRFIANSFQQARILPPHVPQHVLAYGVDAASDVATPGAAAPATTSADAALTDAAPSGAALPDAARGVWVSGGAVSDAASTGRVRAEQAGASGAQRRPLRFGYIGALLPHKGVHVAIEAFAGIEAGAARLEVWGVGDDVGYRKRLEASGRSPGVTFHGAFPESAKGEVLRSLDVLIVPSIGLESFGIVAREAMAHGVPVVASRLGALAELEGGELFEAGDVAALARLITRIIAEPELLRRWRAALPRIKTVDEHAEEIERIYDDVIRRQAR